MAGSDPFVKATPIVGDTREGSSAGMMAGWLDGGLRAAAVRLLRCGMMMEQLWVGYGRGGSKHVQRRFTHITQVYARHARTEPCLSNFQALIPSSKNLITTQFQRVQHCRSTGRGGKKEGNNHIPNLSGREGRLCTT
jgi:hypothetical protein